MLFELLLNVLGNVFYAALFNTKRKLSQTFCLLAYINFLPIVYY